MPIALGDISCWQDIVAVSAGENHLVGLKENGTVIAVGDNEYGQCDTGDWEDVVAISAGSNTTVGLKRDGTVVAVGRNDCGQCETSRWRDIGLASSE
jgi:alpha-tubulin suppressor-like RCC1 family protein